MDVLNNPYEGVDWGSWDQMQAIDHSHTDDDKSHFPPAHEQIEGMTGIAESSCNQTLDIFAISPQFSNDLAWPWTDLSSINDGWEDRDPEELGLWTYRAHEHTDTEHMLASYMGLGPGESGADDWEEHVDTIVEDEGGLCYVPHPHFQDQRDDPSEYNEYVDAFSTYWPDLYGISIYAVGSPDDDGKDSRQGDDERLWGHLLDHFEPGDTHVWAVADDDGSCVSNQDEYDKDNWRYGGGLRWNTVLVEDKQTLDHEEDPEIRTAYQTGRFYVSMRKSHDIFSPDITQFDVDEDNQTISIDADKYDTIEWVEGPQDNVIQTGTEFDWSDEDVTHIRARVLYNGDLSDDDFDQDHSVEEPYSGSFTQHVSFDVPVKARIQSEAKSKIETGGKLSIDIS